jgi:tetratricopeptide (TPR) repeat protein
MTLLRKCLCVLVFASLVSLSSAAAAAPSTLSAGEAQAWRDDLHHLAAELPRRHKDFFHRTSRAEFDAAVGTLDSRIPALARHQVIVEFARLVAMGPDGHTAISGLLYDSPARFRYLPIGLYLFRDGLYIYAADPKYAQAVGARVIRIGNLPAADAVKAVAPLIPRDNAMAIKERAPLYLECPEILHALGLVADMERVPFTVEKGGRQMKIELVPSPSPKPTKDNWALGQRFSKLDGWIDARAAAPTPLWLRDPTSYFWSTYLDDDRTLYAQYNEVADKPDETVARWVDRIREVLRTKPVERFVLDLRWNTGGNNYLNKPLLLALIKSEKVNQPGRLFAIIGRRNFSAAQNLVNDLDKYTDALFVGEPTAGNPNFFGDPTSITLPHSRLVVRASTLWWQDVDPRSRKPWTGPDLAVELSFTDYRDDRDPALDLILRYKPERPLTERMLESFARGDTAGAIRLYHAFRADPVNAYAETEGAMNGLGYKLLGERKAEEAIAVFRLNTESYPQSPNTFDSLGEAYLAKGDRTHAVESYRKVLELDPNNGNAAEVLRRLATGN